MEHISKVLIKTRKEFDFMTDAIKENPYKPDHRFHSFWLNGAKDAFNGHPRSSDEKIYCKGYAWGEGYGN